MRRKQRFRGVLLLAVTAFILWLVWQRVHFVMWVQMPWWGALIGLVVIVLLVDHLLDRVL